MYMVVSSCVSHTRLQLAGEMDKKSMNVSRGKKEPHCPRVKRVSHRAGVTLTGTI